MFESLTWVNLGIYIFNSANGCLCGWGELNSTFHETVFSDYLKTDGNESDLFGNIVQYR